MVDPSLHEVLQRQLARLGLDVKQLPADQSAWLELLRQVSQAYQDADQAQYLHERSLALSSTELMDLNERLEHAQQIARLGYWHYDRPNDRIIWSKGFYQMISVPTQADGKGWQGVLTLIHPDDHLAFKKAMKQAINANQNFELELRFIQADQTVRWYVLMGQYEPNRDLLSGIIMDIQSHKEYEDKITRLHKQLVSSARRAGMAEVATSILHNIGNILNSANVSLNMLKERAKSPYRDRLFKIMAMIHNHKENLIQFFSQDSKGQLIPDYLDELGKRLAEDDLKNIQELENLREDIQHIAEIVNMQQSISGLSSLVEPVYLPDLIETALSMGLTYHKGLDIAIVRSFQERPTIQSDKSKLLQILVNLIQNAKDALLADQGLLPRKIEIKLECQGKKWLHLGVQDNGIGIAPEHLDQLFNFGFTTKKKGHGFGLHSAALAARELGGELRALSDGPGQGAQFILVLPLHPDAVPSKE